MNTTSNKLDIDQTCLAAYKSISITSQGDSLYVSPCCSIQPGMLTTGDIDFEKHELLVQIRTAWQNGEIHNECRRCTQLEDRGLPSSRQTINQGIQEYYTEGRANRPTTRDEIFKPEILRMDYWVGDMCNLACVTCGPDNSSMWRQILGYPKSKQKISANNFWNKVDFGKITDIHIHGGEPFLSRDHVEFIQAIPDKHRINLVYNTNGTVRPGPEVFEAWREFRHIEMKFSFDDLGNRFEYLRWPAKWDQALETFEFILSNISSNSRIGLFVVESMLNSPYMDEIKIWWQQNYPVDKYKQAIQFDTVIAAGSWGPADTAKDYLLKTLALRNYQYGKDWRELFSKSVEAIERQL